MLKSAIIKSSEYGIFVLMGIENQSDIHYAMPVKNIIYDARYPDDADRRTYGRWKARFVYHVARNMGWI